MYISIKYLMPEVEHPKQFGPQDAMGFFVNVSIRYPANYVLQGLAVAELSKPYLDQGIYAGLAVLFLPENQPYIDRIKTAAEARHKAAEPGRIAQNKKPIKISAGQEIEVLAGVTSFSEIVQGQPIQRLKAAIDMSPEYDMSKTYRHYIKDVLGLFQISKNDFDRYFYSRQEYLMSCKGLEY